MPVEVKGLDEVLKAMRQFEPDLAKNLNKQVRAALAPVQKKARVMYLLKSLDSLIGHLPLRVSRSMLKLLHSQLLPPRALVNFPSSIAG